MEQTTKNILLAVTGGIAAYKAPDLVRRLQDNGFHVRVAMTAAAQSFIGAITLQAVSGYPVHHQLFDQQAEAAMGHIELAKWADLILIAPASANCLSKIAHGIADDLLTTTILASSAELFMAPAMNQQMWKNAAIIANVERLKKRGIQFLGPDAGQQACGDTGFGRMREPSQLALDILRWTESKQNLAANAGLHQVRLLITAGPTLEAIDPVRYLSNHSSGKMGYAIANAFIKAGAKVTLISGPVQLDAPEGATVISVKSAQQMLSQVQQHLADCNLFVGCAAVADYRPSAVAAQKIKKSTDKMQLTLIPNPDIIAWVGQQKKRPFVVGFAAESENIEAYAKQKLVAKNMDMICANDISDSAIGFNSDNNALSVFTRSGQQIDIKTMAKDLLAETLVKEIVKAAQLVNT